MKVKINKTSLDAITPTYGSEGAACFDLYAIEGGSILPGEAMTFDTGIAFEVPQGHYMAVHSRSGMGFKNNVRS